MARPRFKIGQAVRFQHWLSKPGNAWDVRQSAARVVNDFYALKGYRRLTAL